MMSQAAYPLRLGLRKTPSIAMTAMEAKLWEISQISKTYRDRWILQKCHENTLLVNGHVMCSFQVKIAHSVCMENKMEHYFRSNRNKHLTAILDKKQQTRVILVKNLFP